MQMVTSVYHVMGLRRVAPNVAVAIAIAISVSCHNVLSNG